MRLELNCFETYPYKCSGSRFEFTTAYDIVVTVDLSRDPRFFPDNPEIEEACNFFIETNRPSMQPDLRLRNTVLAILANFLVANDAIIIYYCDQRDGRGHLRHAKFNRWFGLVNDPSIEKHDRQVTVVDLKVGEGGQLMRLELTVYASMLLRKTHPDYDAAIRIFHSGDADKTGKL